MRHVQSLSPSLTSSNPADRAAASLIHYLRLGLGEERFDKDATDLKSEICQIVDDIVDASMHSVFQQLERSYVEEAKDRMQDRVLGDFAREAEDSKHLRQ